MKIIMIGCSVDMVIVGNYCSVVSKGPSHMGVIMQDLASYPQNVQDAYTRLVNARTAAERATTFWFKGWGSGMSLLLLGVYYFFPGFGDGGAVALGVVYIAGAVHLVRGSRAADRAVRAQAWAMSKIDIRTGLVQ